MPRWRSLSADETECHLSLLLENSPLVRLRLERGRFFLFPEMVENTVYRDARRRPTQGGGQAFEEAAPVDLERRLRSIAKPAARHAGTGPCHVTS